LLLLGFAAFSAMIGGISRNVSQLQEINKARLSEELLVRRFVDTNGITPVMGARISMFLKHRKRDALRVIRDEIPHLSLLPPSLRIDMHYEMYMDTLTSSPVFAVLDSVDPLAFKTVCDRALSEQVLTREEEPFVFKAKGLYMRFIKEGTLTYHPCCYNLNQSTGKPLQVQAGDLVSEATLWLEWRHQGLLRAESTAWSINVHADVFAQTISEYRAGDAFARDLCILYKESALEQSDIDDLSLVFATVKDLKRAGCNRKCTSFDTSSTWRNTAQRWSSAVLFLD